MPEPLLQEEDGVRTIKSDNSSLRLKDDNIVGGTIGRCISEQEFADVCKYLYTHPPSSNPCVQKDWFIQILSNYKNQCRLL